MFRRQKSINDLKRKWMCILFLVVFVSFGFMLSGGLQSQLNNQMKSRVVTIDKEADLVEYEEELPELLEPIEIEKPRELYVLINY